MQSNFSMSSEIRSDHGSVTVSLTLASRGDIELIRKWKNASTGSFFYQAQISKSQQEVWFDDYLQRDSDYMFIVSLNESVRFGCLGCRYVKGEGWDLYNIINGLETTQKRGLMSIALKQLLDFCQCRPSTPITLKVVSRNPARFWYKRNGFLEVKANAGFVLMKYSGKTMSLFP